MAKQNVKRQIIFFGLVLAAYLTPTAVTAKTVYVHLINGNDRTGDGTYSRPYKSWRMALREVALFEGNRPVS